MIIVSVHARYFSFFSFFSFFSLCQTGYVRLRQVTSGYIRLRQFTSEGRDVELDNILNLKTIFSTSETQRGWETYLTGMEITGHPQWTVVRDQPFYSSSLCQPHPHWGNMTSCPHRYVNGAGTGDGYAKIDMTITRNDVIDVPEINNIFKDPWHPKMSTNHSYLFSFPDSSQVLPR